MESDARSKMLVLVGVSVLDPVAVVVLGQPETNNIRPSASNANRFFMVAPPRLFISVQDKRARAACPQKVLERFPLHSSSAIA
jgi:hypothetical protein